MKQLIAYAATGFTGVLLATAVMLGEPAHADLAVVQVATQDWPALMADAD
ncbi:MAG: hypothetical protein J0H69_13190 [Burkholderiales bacterium]|jgi:hypothetical protein|nr:hypothetical protein [Burkholderiales bacterium]